jgi:hypothetical protein
LTTGAVGAAAVVFSTDPSKAGSIREAEAKTSGYRETEHIRKYYESARF